MHRSCKAAVMEQKELLKELPEHLVEEIVARIPFPYVLQARRLSKSWLVKLSPTSSVCDETAWFQKLLSEKSKKTFCPLSFGQETLFGYDRRRKTALGYDSASYKWETLPSLSFLPKNLILAKSTLQIEGAILHVYVSSHPSVGKNVMIRGKRPRTKYPWRVIGSHLLVANILTQRWKILPPRPHMTYRRDRLVLWKKVINYTSRQYKIITVCVDYSFVRLSDYTLQIYDSNSDAWITKAFIPLRPSLDLETDCFAYLHGILYISPRNRPLDFLAFNVEAGSTDEFKLSYEDVRGLSHFTPTVCDGNLLMVANKTTGTYLPKLLKIDFESLRLSEVASPADLQGMCFGDCETWWVPFTDGKSIFFWCNSPRHAFVCSTPGELCPWCASLLAYNVEEDNWRVIRVPAPSKWIPASFQPGLNLFMAV